QQVLATAVDGKAGRGRHLKISPSGGSTCNFRRNVMKRLARNIAVLAMTLSLSSAAVAEELIKIVTTSPGVPWNILGSKVAAELNKRLPNISASAGTGGSTANVSDVAKGNAQLGWTVNST